MSSPPLSASVVSTASTVPVHRRTAGYRFSTLCTTIDNPDAGHADPHGSSSVPIYQTATFKGLGQAYDYSRSGNPTRTFLEYHVAKLAGAKHAFAVSSGMGALDVILRTLRPGDEVIAGNDLYGGSNRLLTYLHHHAGITVHHIDTTALAALTPFLTPASKVRLVLLESPTNPLLQIVDIEQIAKKVKEAIPGVVVVADNTMMSPYLMRPLEFGADIVYDSGTKYLSGHHDLMAGLIVTNSTEISNQIKFIINSIGNSLSSFDCFLLLRGIKTLALRLDKQQASALRVAKYLDRLGFTVLFPGLENHPGKEVHDRVSNGPGAVLSFGTGDWKLSQRIVSSTRLWGISVSFGCVNSLISMPCLMSHASIDPAVRAERNLPEDLIRLCVGIEDCDDLLEDLQASLLESKAIRIIDETDPTSALERIPMSHEDENEIVCVVKENVLPERLLVSAPGKIILFGEHAVVYGKKALATSIDLRCFGSVEPSNNLSLLLPDSKFKISWDLSEILPFFQENVDGVTPEEIDGELSERLGRFVREKVHVDGIGLAVHAFLYLFVHLATNESRRAQTFTIRSALPVGAGLGSSASYTVTLSTLLLSTHSQPPLLTPSNLKKINSWAFLGEKILHGKPSGVDNTVSTFGGSIIYKKNTVTGNSEIKLVEKEKLNIDIMIINSNVSRDTKKMVDLVYKRKVSEPDYVNEIMENIENLTKSFESGGKREEEVGEMIKQNQVWLSALGIGHEKLDLIGKICLEFGLVSKITGAGGGGCAISLLPTRFEGFEKVKDVLEDAGFTVYKCKVGGKGVGVLSVDEGLIDKFKDVGIDLLMDCFNDGNGDQNWVFA